MVLYEVGHISIPENNVSQQLRRSYTKGQKAPERKSQYLIRKHIILCGQHRKPGFLSFIPSNLHPEKLLPDQKAAPTIPGATEPPVSYRRQASVNLNRREQSATSTSSSGKMLHLSHPTTKTTFQPVQTKKERELFLPVVGRNWLCNAKQTLPHCRILRSVPPLCSMQRF